MCNLHLHEHEHEHEPEREHVERCEPVYVHVHLYVHELNIYKTLDCIETFPNNILWSSCISHTFTMFHWSSELTVCFPPQGAAIRALGGATHTLELG